MYKKNLILNNLQCLIYYKTKPKQTNTEKTERYRIKKISCFFLLQPRF